MRIVRNVSNLSNLKSADGEAGRSSRAARVTKFGLHVIATACIAAAANSARASTVSQIEAGGPTTGSNSVTLSNGTTDPYAIVTAIASQPGTLDGYTYTSYSFLANDGTGSLEVFGYKPASPVSNAGYAPSLGDAVSITSAYAVFSGIPEMDSGNGTTTGVNSVSMTQIDSGYSTPAPKVETIPTLKLGANQSTISEYVVELDNVALSVVGGGSTFATHANTTLTATDSSSNTFEVYQWASSYSAAAAFGGQPVPTGLVDITGIVDYSTGFPPELIPFTITSVPEPVGMGVLALAGVSMLGRRRRVR